MTQGQYQVSVEYIYDIKVPPTVRTGALQPVLPEVALSRNVAAAPGQPPKRSRANSLFLGR